MIASGAAPSRADVVKSPTIGVAIAARRDVLAAPGAKIDAASTASPTGCHRGVRAPRETGRVRRARRAFSADLARAGSRCGFSAREDADER
jgi:hypothetical protein